MDKKYVANPSVNKNPYWNGGMESRGQPQKNVASAPKKVQPKKLFGLF